MQVRNVKKKKKGRPRRDFFFHFDEIFPAQLDEIKIYLTSPLDEISLSSTRFFFLLLLPCGGNPVEQIHDMIYTFLGALFG